MVAAKEVPNVQVAWARTMEDLAPVGKDSVNTQQNFRFRGIDQVMNALAGPCRKHGTFVVPRILESAYATGTNQKGNTYIDCHLTVEYTVYGPAGDSFSGSAAGEARDFGDKATSKAMAMAFKYFLFQTGMIPLDASSIEDGDRHSPEQGDGGAGDRAPIVTRSAQEIANAALKAQSEDELRALWVEAGAAKRKQQVRDPDDADLPAMGLGDLIAGLRNQFVDPAPADGQAPEGPVL